MYTSRNGSDEETIGLIFSGFEVNMPFYYLVTGLSPGTTYKFEYEPGNTDGATRSETLTFTTVSTAPGIVDMPELGNFTNVSVSFSYARPITNGEPILLYKLEFCLLYTSPSPRD